jgi:hypothetical protein
MGQSLKDPHTVAAIIHALRRVHGDPVARYMTTKGMSLAALIDTLLRPPLKNGDAVKLITKALRSGDFIATPEIVVRSHLRYIYAPKSFHVVDIAIETLDGTVVSADIHLRLRDSI